MKFSEHQISFNPISDIWNNSFNFEGNWSIVRNTYKLLNTSKIFLGPLVFLSHASKFYHTRAVDSDLSLHKK